MRAAKHSPDRTRRTVGRPPRLTRDRVVTAARQIAARDGAEQLTMRPLADAVGVMPNALYTYFADKAAILDAVLDGLLGDVRRPRSTLTWQQGLIALTVSRPMVGPNALRLREDMLTLLRHGELGESETVTAYFALFAYTTGFVAFETARPPGTRDAKQRAQTHQLHGALPADAFPTTRALAERLARRPGDAEFTRGLRAVIAGFTHGA